MLIYSALLLWSSKKYYGINRLRLHIAETMDFSPLVMQRMEKKFELTTGSVVQEELMKILAEVDVFWFRLGYRIDEAVLNEDSRCRYLVTPVTGIDHIDEALCERLGVSIICLRGETEFLKEVRATAEHTILLAMMVMRRAVPAVNDATAGNWRRDNFRGIELYQKSVGIIGYGRLGRIVADYFHVLGCKVGFYDTEQREHPPHIRQFGSMEECIVASDLVSLHVPYRENTHHLVDARVLNLFTPTKWLVNTSRGGVVDENALLQTLKKQQIAGVATDVLYGEPEVANHPLVKYAQENERLIISPHIGGCTYESFEKTELFVAEKLLAQLNQI